MKRIEEISSTEILSRYKDVIGDDIENFLYFIVHSKESADKLREIMDKKTAEYKEYHIDEKDLIKKRQKLSYQLLEGIFSLKEEEGDSSTNKLLSEIYGKYYQKLTSKQKKEIKNILLKNGPIFIYSFPHEKYDGLLDFQIITKEDRRNIESIHSQRQKAILKMSLSTTQLSDMESIIKEEYVKKLYPTLMKKFAAETIIKELNISSKEYINILESGGEIQVSPEDDERVETSLLMKYKKYFEENFQTVDQENLLLNAAARIMIGTKIQCGEKIEGISVVQIEPEQKRDLLLNSIIGLNEIYKELSNGKYKNKQYAINNEESGEELIRVDVNEIGNFLDRCTEEGYITDNAIEEIHANLANGIFPDDLDKMRIAGVDLEDVTHILNNYEKVEDKEKKEELLISANALVKYLLRNTDIKPEDIIDLYVNGDANLQLIGSMDLKEIPKEYFDKRFMELFGEDVYLDTEETNAKLKRYGNLYSMLREQKQIDTTTDDLVEKLSNMFGEEFVPDIIGELYKTGVANIEEAIQWLGGEFIANQYEQGIIKPVEIREIYNKGIINLEELAEMINLLEDNTEKFMIISSIFPEADSMETRQKLLEECMRVEDSEKGYSLNTGKQKGNEEQEDIQKEKRYSKYVTDPVARFLLMQLLDRDYAYGMTDDGHAVVYLPNLNKVIIEKMLSKYGEPYYGAATYVVDEKYFEENKNRVVDGNRIKRSNLNEDTIFRGVDKIIHSSTGWGKGIKKVLGIDEENRTPEELQQIEEAIRTVEESRTKIEGK